MRKIVMLVVCLGIAGCATTAQYEKQLNTLIGTSEDSLIASWGVPDKTYTLSNGKKALEFVHKYAAQSGGYLYTVPQRTYYSGTRGDKSYSGSATTYVTERMPVEKYKFFCKTSFIIDTDGKVQSWHHEGNNCVAN
ncbi:MAG TPA: hypothetical protein PKL77_08765 [Candidatus Omnitrophota bacterium]|nr:hypothetical protein [Candidatus Omnitrophota bacterium]HPT07428.1 hypothetical protein [Candidatus Omnitrophota bacterium]